MEDDTRLTINVGDIEIDMIGGQSEIEERLTRIKEDGQWNLIGTHKKCSGKFRSFQYRSGRTLRTGKDFQSHD